MDNAEENQYRSMILLFPSSDWTCAALSSFKDNQDEDLSLQREREGSAISSSETLISEPNCPFTSNFAEDDTFVQLTVLEIIAMKFVIFSLAKVSYTSSLSISSTV
ncbi:unnamed protein product [Arabidopsis lyrata]|nr:unnamed protein product [Arabidopsis lyrata]